MFSVYLRCKYITVQIRTTKLSMSYCRKAIKIKVRKFILRNGEKSSFQEKPPTIYIRNWGKLEMAMALLIKNSYEGGILVLLEKPLRISLIH